VRREKEETPYRKKKWKRRTKKKTPAEAKYSEKKGRQKSCKTQKGRMHRIKISESQRLGKAAYGFGRGASNGKEPYNRRDAAKKKLRSGSQHSKGSGALLSKRRQKEPVRIWFPPWGERAEARPKARKKTRPGGLTRAFGVYFVFGGGKKKKKTLGDSAKNNSKENRTTPPGKEGAGTAEGREQGGGGFAGEKKCPPSSTRRIGDH